MLWALPAERCAQPLITVSILTETAERQTSDVLRRTSLQVSESAGQVLRELVKWSPTTWRWRVVVNIGSSCCHCSEVINESSPGELSGCGRAHWQSSPLQRIEPRAAVQRRAYIAWGMSQSARHIMSDSVSDLHTGRTSSTLLFRIRRPP